jgi:hypothetical protein
MDDGVINFKGMIQFGEENLDSTRHRGKLAVSERGCDQKQVFYHLQSTNKNRLCFKKNTFSQSLGTGFFLLS